MTLTYFHYINSRKKSASVEILANIFLFKLSPFGTQKHKPLYKVKLLCELEFMYVYVHTHSLAYILYFIFCVSATLYRKILHV